MINSDLDYTQLDKELDRVKTKVFLNKNSAFLGALLCTLNFSWTSDIKTAETNGVSIRWNPYWFLKLPVATRETVLLHELWHVAFLHMLRCGMRNPFIWNFACDIVINNMLRNEGHSFEGTKPWLEPRYGTKPAEEIYDDLYQIGIDALKGIYGDKMWGHEDTEDGGSDLTDLVQPEDELATHPIINNVVQAQTAATMGGMTAGSLPGEIETILKRFLNPKLPWEQILFNFFNEKAKQDFSWKRPNRRYRDIYLPSLQDEDGGLDHLQYYLDVSGSVSDAEVIRFNSEVKYIKDHFNPKKLSLILFDTIIQKEYDFLEDDPFEEVVVVGRGGTSLVPVREKIIKEMPQAVIIFSDLQCTPMEDFPPGVQIPVIWVCINNPKVNTPSFGTITHIRE